MANNGLAFLGGLGMGALHGIERKDRLDLADREQALREQEFQTRKALVDERLSKAEQERKDQQAIRDAGKPAEIKDATTLDTGDGAKVYDMPVAKDIAASDVRQFRRNNEQTGTEAPAPVTQDGSAVNGKFFADKEGGIKAAQEYDDPDAQVERTRKALIAAGRPDAAMDYAERAQKYKTGMAAAKSLAIVDHVVAQPDDEAAAKLGFNVINQHLAPSGMVAAYTMLPEGGFSANIFKRNEDGSTGEPAGKSMMFKNRVDFGDYLRRAIVPGRALAEQDAARAAAAKTAGKVAEVRATPHVVAPGAMLSSADGSTNVVNTGKTPEERKEEFKAGREVHPMVAALFTKDEPELLGKANANFKAITTNNQGTPPEDAARMAARIARDGGRTVKTEYSPQAGAFVTTFDDTSQLDSKGSVIDRGTGNKYILNSTTFKSSDAEKISPEMSAKIVGQIQTSDKGMFQHYVDSIKDGGVKLHAQAMDDIKTVDSNFVAAKKSAKTQDDLNRALARYNSERNKIEAMTRNAEVVRNLYRPPAPAKATSAVSATNGDAPEPPRATLQRNSS